MLRFKFILIIIDFTSWTMHIDLNLIRYKLLRWYLVNNTLFQRVGEISKGLQLIKSCAKFAWINFIIKWIFVKRSVVRGYFTVLLVLWGSHPNPACMGKTDKFYWIASSTVYMKIEDTLYEFKYLRNGGHLSIRFWLKFVLKSINFIAM